MQVAPRLGTWLQRGFIFAVLTAQWVVGHSREYASGKQEVIYFKFLTVTKAVYL